jgi:hypothetical protein
MAEGGQFCRILHRLQTEDESWKSTVQTVLNDHAKYIASREFQPCHYSPEFRELMEETLNIRFSKTSNYGQCKGSR